MALTCAVLYPIVVELVLKHLWEQGQGKIAMRNHNVYNRFVQLNSEIERDVKFLYNQCYREYKSAIDIGQQHGIEVVAVTMANLEDSLLWNEKAAKKISSTI